MIDRQLKPIESWELATKKVTENLILTDIHLYEDWLVMF